MNNIDHKWPVVYPTAMVSRTLPAAATKALQEAALLDTAAQVGESVLRTRALDAVIARIKVAYPQFFKEEGNLTPYIPSFLRDK